jgi:hypothetical protein
MSNIFAWLLLLPAVLMAIGALKEYKSWNKWWIAHPRLANSQAQYIPLTVILVSYCLALWPFLSWGMGAGFNKFLFLFCVLPYMAIGAFHFAVFIKPKVDKFDLPKGDDDKTGK